MTSFLPAARATWSGRANSSVAQLLSDKGRLGGGRDEVRELKCLNRVLRWTPSGYEIEADPRHAEILIRGLSLARVSTVSKSRFW